MGGWAPSGVAGVLPCAFLGSVAPSSPCVPGLVFLPSGACLGVASPLPRSLSVLLGGSFRILDALTS